jgi:rhamnose utilization protein RhaD (predicted bifunctional aldolase and dehydrogenase)/NAD(P)-dependent dehydrogenase (short-subunit alcohol dehydrogenase family)
MKNRWNDEEAARCRNDLELRVYTSRLLGQDPGLVLHGGGNTSVKISETNLFGEQEDILYVKGSGWDLATIEAEGFTPIRLNHLKKLSMLDELSDLDMVNEMKTHQTNAASPTGSVEAILHAVLPFRFVDHTHADAIVTITNTPDGEQRIKEVFGDEVIIIPYVMPGFDLAKMVADRFNNEATGNTKGMVLMNHGLFSFADSAAESYNLMIRFVQQAEDYLKSHQAWELPDATLDYAPGCSRVVIAELRRDLSSAANSRFLLRANCSDQTISFARREDSQKITQRGPATPDHVIRTKRLPMLGRDFKDYVAGYKDYFNRHAESSRSPVSMLDPVPRVILDHEMGLVTVGRSARECQINADIYEHTMQIIQRAEMLDEWQALPEKDIFDVEYWDLEQAKLKKTGKPLEFQGEVVLITGAASGIGKACVEKFMQQGAAVVGLDRDHNITSLFSSQNFLGMVCDVTDAEAVNACLDKAVAYYGGIDMLVINAGVFPGGTSIADLPDDDWKQVMSVNLDANLRLMRLCFPLLKLAPRYGRVVVIGSKNFLAPGPGAAAYSASKAALNQLARIAALEWGGDGIRINSLHPDAVFDTAIWTDDVLQSRAEHYGMTVEAYKTKNILKTEITSSDVAALATAMCSPLFSKTTAAQVPVDGGNDRVI